MPTELKTRSAKDSTKRKGPKPCTESTGRSNPPQTCEIQATPGPIRFRVQPDRCSYSGRVLSIGASRRPTRSILLFAQVEDRTQGQTRLSIWLTKEDAKALAQQLNELVFARTTMTDGLSDTFILVTKETDNIDLKMFARATRHSVVIDAEDKGVALDLRLRWTLVDALRFDLEKSIAHLEEIDDNL